MRRPARSGTRAHAALVAAVLSTAGAAGAGEPLHEWRFRKDRVQGDAVEPLAGGLRARIRGEVAWARGGGASAGAVVLGRGASLAIELPSGEDPPVRGLTVELHVSVLGAERRGALLALLSEGERPEALAAAGFDEGRFVLDARASASEGLRRIAGETLVESGRWYSVALTRTGNEVRLWLDGRLEVTARDVPGLRVAAVVIGPRDDTPHPECMVSALSVHSRALGEDELAARASHARASLPPPRELYGPFTVLLGPFVELPRRDAARITWETREPASSIVELARDGAPIRRVEDAESKRRHALEVGGIDPDTTYRYRIHGAAPSGEEVLTPLYTFDSSFRYAPPDVPESPPPYPEDEWTERYAETARRIVERAGTRRGYCLVLDAGEGRLAYHLARASEWTIVAVERDPARVRRAREALERAGLHGARVSVHQREPGDLPYGPYLAAAITSDACLRTGELPRDAKAVYRVLRPHGGMLVLGRWAGASGPGLEPAGIERWFEAAEAHGGSTELVEEGGTFWIHRRGALPGEGEWTHQYARPDNTASSGDRRAGSDLRALWWGRPGPRPMADRGPRNPAPLAAGGRLYVQGDRVLFGVDAYSGAILWTLQVPELRRANMPRSSSNMAAAGDDLYAAMGPHCVVLDGASGARRRAFEVPSAGPDDPREWGFIALAGGTLAGSATRRGAQYAGDEGEWYEEFEEGSVAKVTSDSLFAMDPESGALKWQRTGGAVIDSTVTIAGGTLYFVESRSEAARASRSGRMAAEIESDQHIVALDLESGAVQWELPRDLGRCRFSIYAAWADDVLLITGCDEEKVFHTYAFDTRARKLLWEHHVPAQKTHHSGHLLHPVVAGGRVYHNKHVLDLSSGEVLRIDPFDYHGCGTASASAIAIFHRFEYHGALDLETLERQEFYGVRGGCWLGQIPAGGILLAPESGAGCSCAHALETSMGFVPSRD